MGIAKLERYGLLQVTGAEARAFLHAQLTADMEKLAPGRARYAGWCSAKGRLLATFLVIARRDDFLLQLARDLAPTVAKRLSMFILRSKVKLADVSPEWQQYGVFDGDSSAYPATELGVAETGSKTSVRIDQRRVLVLTTEKLKADAPEDNWSLEEIRAGRPLVAQATQDQFVPQMLNLELAGGVDFDKGCYPGQEVVARAQYRGAVKRRMVRLRGVPLEPGQDLYSDAAPGEPSGTVVNAAGEEALAVLQLAALDSGAPIRSAPQGPALERPALPYAQ